MTSKTRRIVAALAIVAAGVVIGTGVLRAQKSEVGAEKDQTQGMIAGVERPWLGVQLKDVTPDEQRDLKLGEDYGAVVEKVEADSPASKAGLQSGDVIVEFAGEKVRSVAELRRLVRETPPGRTVEMRIRRKGEKKTLSASLEAQHDTFGPMMSRLRNRILPEVNMPVYDFPFNFGGPRLGVSVDRLTPQLAEYFGVKGGKGVLVREVEAGSAAEKAGLKAGDCIVQVDSTPVGSVMELHRALAVKPGASREVTLTVVRDRQQQTVKAQLEGHESPAHHPTTESGSLDVPPGMMDFNDLENLGDEVNDEVSAVGPAAEAAAAQARELARDFAAQGGELQKQAAEAARQAREVQRRVMEHKQDWQRELQRLKPEIEQLQREVQKLDFSTV